MAKITYTDHARWRMEQRQISHTDVQKVLDHPQCSVEQGEKDKRWVYSIVDGRSLKVLIRSNGEGRVLVITAVQQGRNHGD